MRSIEKIDKNFAIPESVSRDEFRFYSPEEAPFSLYGVFREGDRFRRLPEQVARSVSKAVWQLHDHTAGGRVRFRTDSSRIVLLAKMDNLTKMPHFPFTGSIGFDLWETVNGKPVYLSCATPPMDISTGYEWLWDLASSRMRELTLHLPLYSGVKEFYIGLEPDATLLAAPEYTHPKPVVYYGSSITQGGCASHPGNAYPNLITTALDCDHINLGFSGSAKAEDEIADYIAGLDMSVFVYDYDHNASTPEYLEVTHERMFRKIRAAQPELPIIMVSKPRSRPSWQEDQQLRFEIIKKTYDRAVAAGDKHVYLVRGTELLGEYAEFATMDNCHPTDLGFVLMARGLAPLIEQLLK